MRTRTSTATPLHLEQQLPQQLHRGLADAPVVFQQPILDGRQQQLQRGLGVVVHQDAACGGVQQKHVHHVGLCCLEARGGSNSTHTMLGGWGSVSSPVGGSNSKHSVSGGWGCVGGL